MMDGDDEEEHGLAEARRKMMEDRDTADAIKRFEATIEKLIDESNNNARRCAEALLVAARLLPAQVGEREANAHEVEIARLNQKIKSMSQDIATLQGRNCTLLHENAKYRSDFNRWKTRCLKLIDAGYKELPK